MFGFAFVVTGGLPFWPINKFGVRPTLFLGKGGGKVSVSLSARSLWRDWNTKNKK